MFSTWVIFGCVAAFTVPVFCCRPKEFLTSYGECCPMCDKGTVVRRDCTEQSGPRCSPCEPGTFMNTPNGLWKCRPCSSCDQENGLFIKEECTKTRDTVCDVLSGYFCKIWDDDTGCSLAEKHTSCEPGQRIKEPGTSRTDTVCEPCQPGILSLDGVNCRAWTFCSGGQEIIKEGTTSSDICEIALRYICILIVFFLFFIVGILIIVYLYFSTGIQPTNERTVRSHIRVPNERRSSMEKNKPNFLRGTEQIFSREPPFRGRGHSPCTLLSAPKRK